MIIVFKNQKDPSTTTQVIKQKPFCLILNVSAKQLWKKWKQCILTYTYICKTVGQTICRITCIYKTIIRKQNIVKYNLNAVLFGAFLYSRKKFDHCVQKSEGSINYNSSYKTETILSTDQHHSSIT
jgi:hypothetical protein